MTIQNGLTKNNMAKREETQSDFKTEYYKYSRLVNYDKHSIWSLDGKCHFHSPQVLEMLKGVEAKAKRFNPSWKIETVFYNKPTNI